MVGDRSGAGGYKNGILAFRAAEIAAQRGQVFEIICVGGLADIEPAYRAAAPSVPMRRHQGRRCVAAAALCRGACADVPVAL